MASTTPQKRKLTDYFSAQPSKKVATETSLAPINYTVLLQKEIAPPLVLNCEYRVEHIPSVPGLELWTDFVTLPEQESILQFLNDSQQCTWRTDLSRRTMHFGGDYCIMPPRPSKADIAAGASVKVKPEIITAPPVPPELMWILDRMNEREIYQQGDRPQYCIV